MTVPTEALSGVFDLLRLAGVSWVSAPLVLRRSELARLLDQRDPCLQAVDQTDDVELAHAWLTLPNVEGVVAKRADRPYVVGRGRDWVKVKRQRSVDCIVVGLAGDLATPKLVLAPPHADGRLHHLGRLGGVLSVIFKRTGVRGRRFVSTQAAGEALFGDGPYPADVRPLPNAEYVR